MIDQARSLVLQELMAIAWIRFESFESIEIIHMGFIDRLNFPVRRPTKEPGPEGKRGFFSLRSTRTGRYVVFSHIGRERG
jgi:hypothetical protein